MIIVRLMGGLGNQLFQYACARRLALTHNTDVGLDLGHFSRRHGWHTDRAYQLRHFCLTEHFASDKDIYHLRGHTESRWSRKTFKWRRRLFPAIAKRYRQEAGLAFDPAVLNWENDVYLKGFWLDERYFSDQASVIRSDLRFREPLTGVNASLAGRLQEVNAVSIHVRRGDYISNPQYRAQMAHLEQGYYSAAIDQARAILKDPVFVIFSDDVPWVRAHLSLPESTIWAEANDADAGYRDLHLMSLCRHHIIANSTFSWWGAWLNPHPEKRVWAPQQWYAQDEPGFAIIPETWTKVALQ